MRATLKGVERRNMLAARARFALVKAANNYAAVRTLDYADKLEKAVRRHIRAEVNATFIEGKV